MKKLKRFNKSNKKNIMPLVALCLVVAIVSAAISYAVYQKEDEVLFINAKVGEFETSNSDIEFAMTLDGADIDIPPEKNSLYIVTVNCDNAIGRWDMDEWGAIVTNISSNRVKCNVNFETLDVLAAKVELGDYISMTPTSTSYTIPSSLTGYTSNQTINPSELNLWRVIKKNEDGTVEMVSDKVSSTNVYFKGRTGYINFIKGLNTIAAQYTDGKHVQSARHIGYSNQTETITNTSKLTQTTSPWTKKTGGDWTQCDASNYLCGAGEALGAGDIGYQIDYNLLNGVYESMSALSPNGIQSHYWLASRRYAYYGSRTWYFDVRFATTAGTSSAYGMYYYDGSHIEQVSGCAVRVVVTIKSSVGIATGFGTEESPYELA